MAVLRKAKLEVGSWENDFLPPSSTLTKLLLPPLKWPFNGYCCYCASLCNYIWWHYLSRSWADLRFTVFFPLTIVCLCHCSCAGQILWKSSISVQLYSIKENIKRFCRLECLRQTKKQQLTSTKKVRQCCCQMVRRAFFCSYKKRNKYQNWPEWREREKRILAHLLPRQNKLTWNLFLIRSGLSPVI